MKVYIVTIEDNNCSDNFDILGTYSSNEKAEECIKEFVNSDVFDDDMRLEIIVQEVK